MFHLTDYRPNRKIRSSRAISCQGGHPPTRTAPPSRNTRTRHAFVATATTDFSVHEAGSIPALITIVLPLVDLEKLIKDALERQESETIDDSRLHLIAIELRRKWFGNKGFVHALRLCASASAH